eukprot:3776811-Prorocentrum_lima.AAC.1
MKAWVARMNANIMGITRGQGETIETWWRRWHREETPDTTPTECAPELGGTEDSTDSWVM